MSRLVSCSFYFANILNILFLLLFLPDFVVVVDDIAFGVGDVEVDAWWWW